MPEDIESRLMSETVSGGFVTIEGGNITTKSEWGNYTLQETTVAGGSSIMYDLVVFGYFDLSGYHIDDKTVFPQAVMLNRIGTYGLDKLQVLVNPIETVVVSTTPLSMNDMTIDLAPGHYPPSPGAFKPHPPGSLVSGHSLQQIVLGEQRNYTLDVGAAMGRITESTSWGLADSTAAEKLYYARAIRLPRYMNDSFIPTPADYAIQIPDLAISIPILVGKEAELQYMMRLQRSVVLAQDAGKQLGD